MADLVVVGGGLSGVLEALRAAEAGESVVLLEASNRLGGAIRATQVDGYEVDAGAESFSVVSEEFQSLLRNWGLQDSLVSPESVSAHIVLPDGHISIPHGVMGIPAGAEALRRSGALSQEEVDDAVRTDQASLEVSDSVSVADLVRSRLGDQVYRRLVRPVVTGVWGEAADQLEARQVMPELLQRARHTGSLLEAARQLRDDLPQPGLAVQSLRGGLHTLVDRMSALLSRAGVQVEYNAPVTGLRAGDVTWQVLAGREWDARRVCLAVGPDQTRTLLESSGIVTGQEAFPSALPSRVLIASLESSLLDGHPWGSGALIADEVGADIKAFSHLNAKWGWWHHVLPPGRHLLRMSLRETSAAVGDPEVLARRALAQVIGDHTAIIRDLVISDWPDVLSRPASTVSTNWLELAERAGRAGVTLAGSAIPGSGLLRLARHDVTVRQQKEEHVPVG